MKLSLQKLVAFGSIGLSSILVAANVQQQKPFQNHNALDVKTILKQHDKPNTLEAHEKHFEGDTLAYVTPWNNRGYDIVKEFKGKFDYVSPVWYYIQRRTKNRSSMEFDIDGEHDVDQGWMKEVKDEFTGKGKILPRFQFRGWTGDDLRMFVSNKAESQALAEKLMDQVNKYNFDGVVIECGFPAFFQVFLSQLSTQLHNNDRQLIVVLPAIMTDEHRKYMTPDIFKSMAHYVDRFSLMTYDFSSHDPNGGPSSPIEWIMDNIEYLAPELEERSKLLIGFNMYAMSYLPTRAPEPLVMKTVIEKLRDQPKERMLDDELFDDDVPDEDSSTEVLIWDAPSQEAWFVDIDEEGIRQGTVWLPTLRSIKNRVRLAEDYGGKQLPEGFTSACVSN
ncbi:hypothetical protein MBANPS3_007799 [Mucor bainieri]